MLQLLRDAYEHWDTERSKFMAGKGVRGAVAELASIAPHARPWSVVLSPEGPVLAGAVSLRDLQANLALLESELLEFERTSQVGSASDADEASQYDVDDA